MSGESSSAVQAAVYQALIDADVASDKIYDYVPEDAEKPYIVVEDISAKDLSSMGKDGQSVLIQLGFYDDKNLGKKQIQLLQAAAHDVLHKGTLSISGQVFGGIVHEFSSSLLSGDGLTYKGVSRYRVITTEA